MIGLAQCYNNASAHKICSQNCDLMALYALQLQAEFVTAAIIYHTPVVGGVYSFCCAWLMPLQCMGAAAMLYSYPRVYNFYYAFRVYKCHNDLLSDCCCTLFMNLDVAGRVYNFLLCFTCTPAMGRVFHGQSPLEGRVCILSLAVHWQVHIIACIRNHVHTPVAGTVYGFCRAPDVGRV